jgi:hypothetical protein
VRSLRFEIANGVQVLSIGQSLSKSSNDIGYRRILQLLAYNPFFALQFRSD